MTGIWLIRHGEAEGNLYRRIHGWYDGSLTAMGFSQLPHLTERFRDVPLAAVYASDLRRAMDTARALSEPRGLLLRIREDLREVNMGAWEDVPWGWVERFDPEEYRKLNKDPWHWSVPGCEPGGETVRRMERALLDIAAKHPGGEVAVASHGSAIRLLLAYLQGVPSEGIWQVPFCDNTAVARITAEGGRLTLVSCNDNSHLPESLSAFHRDSWWKSDDGKDGRDLYYLPMDLSSRAGQETYLRRYRETWIASYGSDRGFSRVHLDGAKYRQSRDPGSVLEVYREEEPIGILELATHQGEEEGFGHIALLHLEEEARGQGLGVQLLGAAVSWYRDRGRKKLRLRVAEENGTALRFYRRWGFTETGREEGLYGTSLVMTKDIPEGMNCSCGT